MVNKAIARELRRADAMMGALGGYQNQCVPRVRFNCVGDTLCGCFGAWLALAELADDDPKTAKALVWGVQAPHFEAVRPHFSGEERKRLSEVAGVRDPFSEREWKVSMAGAADILERGQT